MTDEHPVLQIREITSTGEITDIREEPLPVGGSVELVTDMKIFHIELDYSESEFFKHRGTSVEELFRQYVREGWTPAEMAKYHDVTSSTIYRWLKRANIDRNESTEDDLDLLHSGRIYAVDNDMSRIEAKNKVDDTFDGESTTMIIDELPNRYLIFGTLDEELYE